MASNDRTTKGFFPLSFYYPESEFPQPFLPLIIKWKDESNNSMINSARFPYYLNLSLFLSLSSSLSPLSLFLHPSSFPAVAFIMDFWRTPLDFSLALLSTVPKNKHCEAGTKPGGDWLHPRTQDWCPPPGATALARKVKISQGRQEPNNKPGGWRGRERGKGGRGGTLWKTHDSKKGVYLHQLEAILLGLTNRTEKCRLWIHVGLCSNPVFATYKREAEPVT